MGLGETKLTSLVKTTSGEFGFLLDQYRKGNSTAVNKLTAAKSVQRLSLRIVCFWLISRSGSSPSYAWRQRKDPKNGSKDNAHYRPEALDEILRLVRERYGSSIDESRAHLVGYSMGSRGALGCAEARPNVSLSMSVMPIQLIVVGANAGLRQQHQCRQRGRA